MELIIIVIFILGYVAIAMEHPLRINKAASALLTCVVCWALYAFSMEKEVANEALLENLSSIISIILFLLGAMSIVETVDMYDGFRIITDRIKTTDKRKLLWIVSLLTFFMSAVLDNLTTTIVMISLLRKLVEKRRSRMIMSGMIIIAANAGGAWTVIGDVTTTMLWIGKQISVTDVMYQTLLPSLACLLVPLTILSATARGRVRTPLKTALATSLPVRPVERRVVFFIGIGSLLFVPIFKSLTHLPPFMGMLLGLSVLWIYTEHVAHIRRRQSDTQRFSVSAAIRRIDMSSVFFFLGILLCVSVLEQIGLLEQMSSWLDNTIKNQNLIVMSIGGLSSVVDNVPLVAAAQGMYSFPTDNAFWTFLAYCAGTGGSILIIGSAAGVAAMGLERIDFIWYLRNFSWLAILGYLAGAGVFLLQHLLLPMHMS